MDQFFKFSGEGIACKVQECNKYTTTKKDEAVKIRFSNEERFPKYKPLSVMQFCTTSQQLYSSRLALKVERDGQWITWTYKEYLEDIRTTAKAFIQLGMEEANSVCIIGFNSPEWTISDIAAIFAGGIAVGIYTTNNKEACKYVLQDSNANIAIVENNIQMQKILAVWDDLPHLKAIVQYKDDINNKRANMYTWKELQEIGKNASDEKLSQRMNSQAPNRCCTLIYTSGTTGNPKGVMLSHDNVVMAAMSVSLSENIFPCDGKIIHKTISYLPLSHIAAQILDVWLAFYLGACVTFARPDALKGSLVETLRVVRPTVFVGVPRVYEKIEEKLKIIGMSITGLKKRISTWAKDVCYRANQNIECGQTTPWGYFIASMIMRKVHVGLGLDRCLIVFVAAAPSTKQMCDYFKSINLPLFQIYGLSETCGATTLFTRDKRRSQSVGSTLCGIESKVSDMQEDDGIGELCFRSRYNMMGYLNNVEKTTEIFDDEGFLHTGDLGMFDEDGFCFVTGRIKEIIITAGGENIAPIPIESRIKEEIPLVATAMIIGDKRKFLTCLLTCQVEIDINTGNSTENLLPTAIEYCSKLGLSVSKSTEIAPYVPEVLTTAIEEAFVRVNSKAISRAARIQKWKLLPHEFTVANGELGPTQKLRRPHVMKMYREIIDAFYDV